MSNDLIFPILPREGKVPMSHDEDKVQKVTKEAKLRRLNDQEKELNAEEREAREKQQPKQSKESLKEDSDKKDEAVRSEEKTVDEHGRVHVDFYI